MAQTAEGTTDAVTSVQFRFMTDEEAISQSVVEIHKPELLDRLDKPCPGGLYDKALGPLDEVSKCVTCGQRPYYCNGHFGHMKLYSPVYNPLLFNSLSKLLNKICLYCFHFQDDRAEVENCVSQLELIMKGDVAGAKKLSLVLGGKQGKKKSDGVSIDVVDSDCDYASASHSDVDDEGERKKVAGWDSFELSEAMSVIDKFFKRKESKRKCRKCKCANPKITKPTFGWFLLSEFSGSKKRSNDVLLSKLDATTRSGSEVVSASDSDDASEKPGRRHAKQTSNNSNQENLDDSLNLSSGPLLPTEVKGILRRCWQNEVPLCSYLCNILQRRCDLPGTKAGSDMFFLETIPVTPIKFRPPARRDDAIMEHPHTVLLGKVLQSTINLENAHRAKAEHGKIVRHWMELQQSINVYFDSKTSTSQNQKENDGICQSLEKKEGVFRQNMMGKRVNFACRSVISPDPYLGVNEIGVPPYFATRLTYPERVTPWNVGKMRDAILNGPDVHPGAITYADSSGTMKLPSDKDNNGRRVRVALSRRLPSSRGAATVSGKRNELDFESKTVFRHLRDGDVVLVNRQPTLHKPSIMAHVVRVLKGEKTLRMHYANCSSYNADFDGDEMNVHFPQDEISRAEAYNIVNANEQYIVPTRGDTVRGLIQDHIVSAVILTLKNTFLTRSEFNQLLYASGVFAFEAMVPPVMPAIWKPEPLWTGKQVITALLNHITRGFMPCNVENLGKIPKNYFASNSYKNGEEEEEHNAEHKFLVRKNELVRGVIDKAQFGKFGLVHTVQELYGSNSAGVLLSALSRLFTIFLQLHGFTCGLDDLIIAPQYDVQRKEKLEGEDVGKEVHCEFVKFEPGKIGPEELQMEIEKAISSDRESATAILDMKMKNKLTNKLTREGSQILKHLLTAGVLKPFPRNCISVMTTTGAKGSTVNFQQISAYLGQQELEGKRVPRMVSGKSLPSFPPWDYTSRAGGFISDRFLTGLRPQEYYFHCMAGREGLVDTAVKTSRSGYLQRCLIKNLEGLRVWNDCTVRDADCSIIQFYYGEDGVDAHKTGFLNNFKALEDNQETFSQKFKYGREFNTYIEKLPEGLEDEVRRFLNASGTEQVQKRKEKKKKKFMELVTQKYLSSLAEAGEPVGVIAAQSVGEPSTQMTLNTFHLAGRGEMNVTLGIPRLQEILMTASDVIKTPILTCPFAEWRSKHDVVSLVSKVKKVAVADLIESMGVQISFHPKNLVRLYKLTIKLKDTEFVSLENTHETLKSVYLRELEDAIENHLKFLKKINVIDNVKSLKSESSYESDVNTPDIEKNGGDEDDDDDDNDMGEDLGSDVAKRKQQATDEVDYDEGSDNELSTKTEEDDIENGKNEETEGSDNELSTKTDDEDIENEESEKCEGSGDEDENMKNEDNKDEVNSEINPRNEKSKTVIKRIEHPSTGKNARAVYLEIRGLSFEVKFKFTNEPHLLLAQVAMKAAKKIYIKKSGKISHCKMVQYDPDEKTIIWEDKLKPKMGSSQKPDEDTGYWAVRASGTDFRSFWEMQDDLDLSRLYSNNVYAMLTTYGVEAARATLIREVKHVFDIYGVKIDYRHLSLIADYMTHTGGYRPMSRHGSISESLSPFLKMSFETASKFIVEAASLGLTDNLETSSSRICLGLPVKVGTGSFDLMQKLEI